MLPLAPSITKGSIRDFCYVFVCCWKNISGFFRIRGEIQTKKTHSQIENCKCLPGKPKRRGVFGIELMENNSLIGKKSFHPLRRRHKQPIEAPNCCWSSSLLHRDTTQKRQQILDPPALPVRTCSLRAVFCRKLFFFESLEQAGKKGLLWWMFRYGFLRAIFPKCRFKTQNWKTFHPQSVQRIAAVSCDHSGRWCMINKWRKSQWESKIPKSSPPNTSENVPVFNTGEWWWFFF